MKLCFTSDLHGDKQLYTQLVDLIHRERPDILLLGGDQCHTVTGDSAIEEQQAWLLTEFRGFLKKSDRSVVSSGQVVITIWPGIFQLSLNCSAKT